MGIRYTLALSILLFFSAEVRADAIESIIDGVPSEAAGESAPVLDDAPATEAGTGETRPAATAQPDAAPSEQSRGSVARAQFTTAVESNEPIDAVTELTRPLGRVYFFTDLRDFANQRVTHRWEYEGQVMAEVPFDVRGDRWRVHSSKNLLDGWRGAWTVSVVDENGRVVAVDTFEYAPAPGSEPAPAPPAAPAPEAEIAPAPPATPAPKSSTAPKVTPAAKAAPPAKPTPPAAPHVPYEDADPDGALSPSRPLRQD